MREEDALPNTATSEAETREQAGAGWRVVTAAYFGVMVSFGSLLVFSFSTFLKPLSAGSRSAYLCLGAMTLLWGLPLTIAFVRDNPRAQKFMARPYAL